MGLIAWKHVQPLCTGARHAPRVHLTVAEAGETPALRPEVKGVQAGAPAPLGYRVLFVLEEEAARLLGVDLEVFPEEPVPVVMELKIKE